MKLDHLILIGDAVEKIHELTETHIPDIVDALTGIAWDEEDAGQIKAYHAYDGEIVLVCIKCKERYYNAQEFFNEDDLSSLQEIDTKEEKQS